MAVRVVSREHGAGGGGYLSKGRVVVVDVGGGNQLRIIFQHRIDCVCMCVVGRGGRF